MAERKDEAGTPYRPSLGEQLGTAMTLTEFLLARIGEDEAMAKAVTPGPWRIEKTSSHMDSETWAVADIERFRGYTNHVACGEDKRLAIYIARHDPARVMAECEAKRWIMKIHTEGLDDFDGSELYSTGCDGCRSALWPCPTILALILPYADHPDYQPEWKL